MTEQEKQALFMSFLKNNRIYDEFLTELEAAGHTLEWLYSNPADCWTDRCFIWLRTKRGREYWDNLNQKWGTLYRRESNG